MVLRIVALFLIVCIGFTAGAAGQGVSNRVLPGASSPSDFGMTVVPISEIKFLGIGVEGKFGTGFCLDPECRFIGTNYHVAVESNPRKIKGKLVVDRYLATGPNDDGATLNEAADPLVGAKRYTLSRDLAVYELRYPLEHHRGVPFDLVELQPGDQVDIYCFPQGGVNPIRHLAKFHARFVSETMQHILAFHTDDVSPHPGASGGVVVKDGKIVGILNAIGLYDTHTALAVKVQALADFLSKVQPYLHAQLFPDDTPISPISADLYPPYDFPVLNGKRPTDPPEVLRLRQQAQAVADNMSNLIAVQSFSWGGNNKIPQREAKYEVGIVDGVQRFREYPDGKKLYQDVPLPTLNDVMAPGGEWSELPQLVGTQLRLKIHQAADAVVSGYPVKVFQWKADPEDDLCLFRSILDFEFFSVSKTRSVACEGEVWTDHDLNIVRMSEHFDLLGRWKNYQAVVTFGWLDREGEPKKLIPVTIASQANLHNKTYWCRGQFTNYQIFDSKVKILAGSLNTLKPKEIDTRPEEQ